MKFIYFHIDERDRDLVVARAISKCFKSKNVKVFFGTRKTNKILRIFHWIFDVVGDFWVFGLILFQVITEVELTIGNAR